MATISFECVSCKKLNVVDLAASEKLCCVQCAKTWPDTNINSIFDSCPLCQCNQFYTQKDFNRGLGCLIMLVGIILVPFTYGLSLPVFFGFDWLLQKRIPTMVVCYRCGAEFRRFSIPAGLKEFMHHIGEKYERQAAK